MNQQEYDIPIQGSRISDFRSPDVRSGHVACKLADCMLLWGGTFDQAIRNEEAGTNTHLTRFMDPCEVWLYYPVFNKWVKKNCSGTCSYSSSGSSVVVFKNTVWILFGFFTQGIFNSMYKINTNNFEFSNVQYLHHDQPAKLPSPRNKHVSWYFNKKIYSFGGYGPTSKGFLSEHANYVNDSSVDYIDHGWNDQLLEFDPVLRTWNEVECEGTIPLARAAHSVTQVGSVVMIFGGRHLDKRLNDLQQLDMCTFTWTSIETRGSSPLGRSWNSLNYMAHDHSLIVLGGFSSSNNVLDDVWKFDLKTLLWKNVTCLPIQKTRRLWHTSVAMDDELVVFGGCSNNIMSEYPDYNHELCTFRTTPQSLYRSFIL